MVTKETEAFFANYGIRPLINASGTMTHLGASPVHSIVIDEMTKILPEWVEINALQKAAGKLIAEVTGAEAGFVTACAAAGITLSIAACMTGQDIGKVMRLPDTNGMKNEVILQKAHSVNFGASVSQMIRLAGAKVIEIGTVSGTSTYQLEAAITDNTAAAMYVVSHHTVQYGTIPFHQFVDVAHKAGIPVVVDAAAEYNFADFIKAGADIVTCSGHKFLFGPTSGLVAGRKDLIQACHMQEAGIGRAMKVGKEGILGLMAALRVWQQRDLEQEHQATREKAQKIVDGLQGIAGLTAHLIEDPTGNPITRVRVYVDSQKAILDAYVVAREMANDPLPIYVRGHHVEEGYFDIETRFLDSKEIDIICTRIRNILNKSKAEKRALMEASFPRNAQGDAWVEALRQRTAD